MKYPPLENPCKSAIAEGRCTGCNLLELPYFKSKKDCKYSIEKKKELGEQVKIWGK